MKNKLKVVYKKPYMEDSDLEVDAIIIYYPYTIENMQTNEASNYVVKVSISGSLAITWGFQTWLEEKEYYELKKILFQYAKTKVIDQIKKKSLQGIETVVLSTTNHPEHKVYDSAKLPEVIGFEEIVEVREK